MKKPTVTIGIPAYNEQENIVFLITSLLSQELKQVTLQEIIVVSDGSTDTTVDIVTSLRNNKIKIVDRKNRRGLNQTLNEIVKSATGDILVIINADVLPENSAFIERLIKQMLKDRNIGIVGANTASLPSRSLFERIIANSHHFKQFLYTRMNNNNIYLCHGRARAFSKDIYSRIVWPDNCPEDAYSYFFCKQQGYRFIFNRTATVLFRCPSNLQGHIKQSNRFRFGKYTLSRYFSEEVIQRNYKIPFNLLLRSLLYFTMRNPFSMPAFLMITAYIRFLKTERPSHYSKYSIAYSSKNLQ